MIAAESVLDTGVVTQRIGEVSTPPSQAERRKCDG
jgi:hypothetical protein